MPRFILKTLPGCLALGLFLCLASRVLASHGPTATCQRDGWIGQDLQALVVAGLVNSPAQPIDQMTNLEVAQALAQATQKVQNADSPAPTGLTRASFERLVQEFRDELALLGVDLDRLEDRIGEEKRRNAEFGDLQKDLLLHTGTKFTGYARGYFDAYRGFGTNAVYGPTDDNDVMYEDLQLKSVPVPFILFNADLRLTRTIGLYYADPVSPTYNLWWLSLSYASDVANLTFGDFYRRYTPLTLWNYDVPLYTLIEPEPYARVRRDIEQMAYMDHGPDWHLRGFQGTTDQAVTGAGPLSSIHFQAMAGELQSAAQYSFAQDYAGGEVALDFFNDQLEILGTGLLLFDDTQDSQVPYVPGLFSTYPKQYQVGSLSALGTLPLQDDASLAVTVEWAASQYQENNGNLAPSVLQDSAILGNGVLHVGSALLAVKYLHNGAYFYSPGAQTNQYTPALGGAGYISNNENLDDGVEGYLKNYVFQSVNRPSFAPFDRMSENILPYGDATPNREGFVLGASVDIGKDGWLKPQATLDLGMREIQPEWVLANGGVSAVDDPQSRTFNNVEGAVKADLAKALEGLPSTCSVALDYKHQTTDLGQGAAPYSVDSFIAAGDAGPFPDLPLLEGLVLSVAYELTQGSGSEYTLDNLGSPESLAEYPFYLDPSLLGQYSLQVMDITRTSWAFGCKLPLSRTTEVHADWFINQYTWASQPGFDRREQIWRVTYELSF